MISYLLLTLWFFISSFSNIYLKTSRDIKEWQGGGSNLPISGGPEFCVLESILEIKTLGC